MRKTNRQKGITLVALVITIIILLILAGISISALTGSGLFEKAQQAQKETENAQAEENATLAEYEQWMGNYIGGSTPGETEKILTDTAETKPAQAMPANATVIENDLSKGIVIKDSSDNEWTWVVVQKNVTEDKTTDTDIETALKEYATTNYTSSWKDEWYDKYGTTYDGTNQYSQVKYITRLSYFTDAKAYYGTIYTDAGTTEAETYSSGTTYYADITAKLTDRSGCGLTYSEYNTAKSNMLQSIKTYGGFWISRYEIGDSTATNNNYALRTMNSGTTGTAVSKANQIPYNHVTCSEAQTLASGMSTDTNKTSSLLFGIQWDLVCKYLQEKGGLSVEQIKGGDGVGSTNWGNYKNSSLTLKANSRYCTLPSSSGGTWSLYNVTGNFVQLTDTLYKTNSDTSYYGLLTTGASEDANKMNIYDFAGNEYEYTLEHATFRTDWPRASMGGCYYSNGSNAPASYRSSGETTSRYADLGFRSTLY